MEIIEGGHRGFRDGMLQYFNRTHIGGYYIILGGIIFYEILTFSVRAHKNNYF